ncbi:type IV secretion system DNA-binding domain-containing protein [Candidatus Gottesmanbacteria bacterium]|nr:type IV secretion system DNA-binding domain-containing protein [Candidatus Gottesmanbacteria bacterium]
MESSFTLLEVKNSRDSEEVPAAMEQVFAALGAGGGHGGLLARLFGPRHAPKYFSFEIVSVNSGIHFFVGLPDGVRTYMESQLTAQYPKVLLSEVSDYAPHFLALPHAAGQLVLTNAFYYPLKTYKDVKDLDILASVLGQMAKLPAGEAVAVQFRLAPAGNRWQQTGAAVIARGIPDPTSTVGRTKNHPHARIIENKISQMGLAAAIRIVAVAASEHRAKELLQTVGGTFGVYTLGEGNNLAVATPAFWQKKKLEQAFVSRSAELAPKFQVLTVSELASLWHPPGMALSAIKNISWGAHLTGEAPENLPIGTESEEDKKRINFFARTEYKNATATFGIKKEDRRKHLYVVGKTGTGKSTMIANMAINDMRNGEGLAVIDPHGDLTDTLLDFIPSFRVNDVVYLDPSDAAHPFHLNPLEVKNPIYRELVASGIVSIFNKLYAHSWGPRLEYILRNTILTLLHVPQATFLQVPELLTNEHYRTGVVEKLPDQVLKNFWLNEFGKMSPQLRSEAVSPILNKVGQFLSSQTIRNIIGSPVSTVDLETAMNEGKIVLVNLSQGKLGEDSSALLGAMIISKLQLASMNRVYVAEGERRDFYLYVDEFQNFATNSFIKILSEARKYRLDLTLANQYIGQIDEEVQKAIFGNAGSIVSFSVGASDARLLTREFGLKYKEEELVGLGNYQVVLKLSIDNHTSSPFSATTLPLPRAKNQNRDKIIRGSRERYTKEVR